MELKKEDTEGAQKLLEFYIDLVENNTSRVSVYLADNVVLDWFGKTIKNTKKVSSFIKEQVGKVDHHIPNAVCKEHVAFKDSHLVTPSRPSSVMSSPATSSKEMTTPPNQILEIGQGDGPHNLMSPSKKMKLDLEEGTELVEGESECLQMKYLSAEGAVEFHKPSIKKLQAETRWQRPVKLHLGYSGTSSDCTIYLIIYEGNVKCRRNLYREFCKCDAKNSA